MNRPGIVVVSPLKNDAWILRRFLEVTSVFADAIVIADQGSTDGGPEICRQFPKVAIVRNPDTSYDEASRQELLIGAGRASMPMPRILMALDVDEILAADAITTSDWQTLLKARPGTTVYFEKPNLFLSPLRCERRPVDFPGAFVDDGTTPHRARRIHSPRLPLGESTLVLEQVKFLHYALVRPEAQKAKMRMYAALENVMGTKSLYWRRRYYWSHRVLRPMGRIEATPPEWFGGWMERGIEMLEIEDQQPYWQDLATLDLLLEHGTRRFWLDDIWEKDWIALAKEVGRGKGMALPPRGLRAAVDAIQSAVEWAASVRRSFAGK
jgi:glycosyltransferase involved in cell wall biosynthesis